MTSARAEDIKEYQVALHRSKDTVMEERERVAALKVDDAEKSTQSAGVDRVKVKAGSTLGEEKTLAQQLTEVRASSSAQKRSVETAMWTYLRGLRREVERVARCAFVGFNQLDGGVVVKEEDVIYSVASPPPS